MECSGNMTWGQLLTEGQNCLKEAGIAEYSLDAWYLFEHAFGMSRMQYLMRKHINNLEMRSQLTSLMQLPKV